MGWEIRNMMHKDEVLEWNETKTNGQQIISEVQGEFHVILAEKWHEKQKKKRMEPSSKNMKITADKQMEDLTNKM